MLQFCTVGNPYRRSYWHFSEDVPFDSCVCTVCWLGEGTRFTTVRTSTSALRIPYTGTVLRTVSFPMINPPWMEFERLPSSIPIIIREKSEVRSIWHSPVPFEAWINRFVVVATSLIMSDVPSTGSDPMAFTRKEEDAMRVTKHLLLTKF